MTKKRRIRSSLSRVSLAALLLAVQISVAGHIDTDGHSQEPLCVVCVSLSTLDAANVSEHVLSFADTAAEWTYAEPSTRVSVRSGGHQQARAPPVAS